MTIHTFVLAALLSLTGASVASAQSHAAATPATPLRTFASLNDAAATLSGADLHERALPYSGAYVSQIGDANTATVTQRQRSARTLAAVVQVGNGNAAVIDQEGTFQWAGVIQEGNANTATVIQDGDAHNTAKVLQQGHHNQAAVAQTALASANVALIMQAGIGNRIRLTQTGSDNSAVLGQEGIGNQMEVDQYGVNNALTWHQLGSNLSGPIVIMEGNRSLTITQTGSR